MSSPLAGRIVSDEEHLARVAQGAAGSFDVLVERYQSQAINFAYRFLGDREEAEEVVQETFLRVFRDSAKFRPLTSFRAWFFQIIANLCRDLIKKHKPVYTEVPPDPPDPGQDPLEYFHFARRQHAIQRAIMRLPEKQRLALLLAVFEGFSQREISASLGVSIKAVESLMVRARRKLRSELSIFLEL